MGEITKKVQERRLKWYGHLMRKEEHYVGWRAMGRRKRRRPKRRWLDKVKDDIIKEKSLSADEVYDRATWRAFGGVCHRTSTPHKSWNLAIIQLAT